MSEARIRIEARELSKRFPGPGLLDAGRGTRRAAIDGVSFSIRDG